MTLTPEQAIAALERAALASEECFYHPECEEPFLTRHWNDYIALRALADAIEKADVEVRVTQDGDGEPQRNTLVWIIPAPRIEP